MKDITNKENTESHHSIEPFYIPKKEVVSKADINASSIDRLEAKGQFPKRIKLGPNKVTWIYTDVLNWCILVEKLKSYPAEGHYTN
jgi:predicted DNA-binding transcriptional regulator AlpA